MSSRKKKIALMALILTATLILALTAGCGFDRWAEIQSGHYVHIYAHSAPGAVRAPEVRSLDIDRESNLLTLTLEDGTESVAPFVPRDRREWPSGCPTNINSTRMEVLDIAQDPLTIGEAAFNRPILVRDCPRDPVRIVLRADGAIGGATTACPYPEPCVYFVPQ